MVVVVTTTVELSDSLLSFWDIPEGSELEVSSSSLPSFGLFPCHPFPLVSRSPSLPPVVYQSLPVPMSSAFPLLPPLLFFPPPLLLPDAFGVVVGAATVVEGCATVVVVTACWDESDLLPLFSFLALFSPLAAVVDSSVTDVLALSYESTFLLNYALSMRTASVD